MHRTQAPRQSRQSWQLLDLKLQAAVYNNTPDVLLKPLVDAYVKAHRSAEACSLLLNGLNQRLQAGRELEGSAALTKLVSMKSWPHVVTLGTLVLQRDASVPVNASNIEALLGAIRPSTTTPTSTNAREDLNGCARSILFHTFKLNTLADDKSRLLAKNIWSGLGDSKVEENYKLLVEALALYCDHLIDTPQKKARSQRGPADYLYQRFFPTLAKELDNYDKMISGGTFATEVNRERCALTIGLVGFSSMNLKLSDDTKSGPDDPNYIFMGKSVGAWQAQAQLIGVTLAEIDSTFANRMIGAIEGSVIEALSGPILIPLGERIAHLAEVWRNDPKSAQHWTRLVKALTVPDLHPDWRQSLRQQLLDGRFGDTPELTRAWAKSQDPALALLSQHAHSNSRDIRLLADIIVNDPAFSQRREAAERTAQIARGNPQLKPEQLRDIIGALLLKLEASAPHYLEGGPILTAAGALLPCFLRQVQAPEHLLTDWKQHILAYNALANKMNSGSSYRKIRILASNIILNINEGLTQLS